MLFLDRRLLLARPDSARIPSVVRGDLNALIYCRRIS